MAMANTCMAMPAHLPKTYLAAPKNLKTPQVERTKLQDSPKIRAPNASVSKKLSGDTQCKKNPGHKHFIPINELQGKHLKEGFRSRRWIRFIQLKGMETVKLEVRHTSEDRPKELGFNEFKGTSKARNGSGTVFLINMDKEQNCPLKDCHIKGDHLVSGTFKIMTAYHVVFNETEALNTKVLFFYDEESSQPIEAQGVRISSVDPKRNRAVVECITHDLTLCNKIAGFRKERMELLRQLPAEAEDNEDQDDKENMVVMISHPHGHAKHVTVGSLVNMVRDSSSVHVEGVDVSHCVVSYTTPTCPGSGGGSVNILCPRRVCIGFAPHCACADKSAEGISGLGWTLAL